MFVFRDLLSDKVSRGYLAATVHNTNGWLPGLPFI